MAFETACRLEQVSKEGRLIIFKRPFNQGAGSSLRLGGYLTKRQVVANKRDPTVYSFYNMQGHIQTECRRALHCVCFADQWIIE